MQTIAPDPAIENRGQKTFPPAWMAWSVWGIGAFFYLMGFYQRVAPAVMTAELMKEYRIGAAGLGNLSAFYYYFYVTMQIPTGILVDSWGPRRLLTFGAVVAAAGTFLFAAADHLFLANLGRGLIGGSVAVAFVVCLKLAIHWLAPNRFALASGMGLFFGVIGAVTAGVPLRLAIDLMGWRSVMAVSGAGMLSIALATWLLVRDDPSEKGYLSYAPERKTPARGAKKGNPFQGLSRIFQYRNTWILFLAPGGLVGPVLAFAGLWGVPFLRARFGLPPAEAAAVCSVLMVSWAIAGPVMGGFSDRIGRRKPIYLCGYLIAVLGWIVLFFFKGLSLEMFVGIIALIGFASGVVVIGFAFSKESVPTDLSGTIVGTINMGIMSGPTLLQPAIGWILDRMWTGRMAGDVRIYDLAAFEAGFSLMLGWSVLGCVLISLTRETHCRQVG
jgi:MFS family permease